VSRYDDYIASLAPVLYFKHNELSGDTAIDFSPGASYMSSYTPNVLKGQPGLQPADYGRSAYFGGTANSMISVPTGLSSALNATVGFTLLMTVQLDGNAGSAHAILSKASAYTVRFNYVGGSVVPVFGLIPGGGGGQSNASAPAVPVGVPVHVAAQFAPSGWGAGSPGYSAIFVGGVLGASRAASIVGVLDSAFRVAEGGNFSREWKGWIQNLAFVASIVPTQTLADLAGLATTPPAPDLLIHLTSPQGSVYPLSSYIRADPGPDFGFGGLFDSNIVTNPAVEGGQLAYESVGVRRMSFPLRLPSSGAFAGLESLEQQLRQAAHIGGYLTVGPTNMASSDWIRWDLLSGRVSQDGFNVFHQKVSRRDVVLELDAQPFGYLPTIMVAASVASVGLPGQVAIAGTAILGDVPGLGRLLYIPTSATTYPAGNWSPDALFWSLSGRPSGIFFYSGASMTNVGAGAASVAGDAFAPGSQSFVLTDVTNSAAWTQLAGAGLPSALEPAHRGRYRLLGLAKVIPSQALPWQFSADVGRTGDALGSAAPIATLAPAVASGSPGAWGAQASPAQTLLDFGEITLPLSGSGFAVPAQTIRLWAKAATTNIPTTQVVVGGLYLQPLGFAGVLPRGIVHPSINAGIITAGGIMADAISGQVGFISGLSGLPIQFAEKWQFHRGNLPQIGATTTVLDLMSGERRTSAAATAPIVRAGPDFAAVSLSYRPRFTFVKGI
jgi:hypothetical protein